jgi:hypothetical protein
MAGEETTNQSNIKLEYNQGNTGINMDNTVNQVAKGTLTYALNASVENFDANSVNYQNEPGNELCVDFPTNYQLVGTHFISEKNKHIFFLANPQEGKSEIGCMNNNDCKYITIVNADCLNFNTRYPILKIVHKITNCTTEIYWTDGFNPRRYLDLENIPYKLAFGSQLCDPVYTNELDCNQLKMQPNFNIPELKVTDITTGGALTAGTYQFAIQYSDAAGNPYTSYYSVTNPTPIANIQLTTPNFNYEVGKSIEVTVSNLDVTGQFQYFNLAVIKTVNAITSVELAGIYFIDRSSRVITYTGQNQEQIKLTINDIFEKYPYYDIAQDLTTAQDVLIWDNLSSIDRINYQSIASRISLQWQTYRIPANENYADGLNATNLRGYLRDEIYAFEIVFLLRNGKQTDGFHIPGRLKGLNEIGKPDIPDTNPDFIGTPEYEDLTTGIGYSPYWKIYNTASVTGQATGDKIGNATPYEYGEFAYWESTEKYPCNVDLWGDLADQPIRHHKFPDVLVSPIFETPTIVYDGNSAVPVMTNDAVFPIGGRVDVGYISSLIFSSNLTLEQKYDIVGFKIVRGDRGTNKSIVAKGILRNVGSYDREGTTYYFPNYPYNDLNEDPFLLTANNAFLSGCQTYRVDTVDGCVVTVKNCITDLDEDITVDPNSSKEICSLAFPILKSGTKTFLGLANYDLYILTATGLRGVTFNYTSPETPSEVSTIFVPYSTSTIPIASITYPTKASGKPYSVQYYDSVSSVIKCGSDIPSQLKGFNDDSKYRHVFNSPETSFGQPFLGNILRLENVIFGAGESHFTQVNKNALYKLLSYEAQYDALTSSFAIAGTDITAAFTAYQAYLTIYINGITRRNYAYSYNTIASYDYGFPIDNNLGVKQRNIDIAQYLIPGVQSVGDDNNINNWNRESSVYIKTQDKGEPETVTYTTYEICYTSTNIFLPFAVFTYTVPETKKQETISIPKNTCQQINSLTLPVLVIGASSYTITVVGTGQTTSVTFTDPLPFPSDTPSLNPTGTSSIIYDESRHTISSGGLCDSSSTNAGIKTVVYYASIKNEFVNQWGQIYSYNTIDTGFQRGVSTTLSNYETVFGGDTFISRFAFKTKLPFFIDNRVGAPDDSDIFYDEIGNVAYPRYWHSARSVLFNFGGGPQNMTNIISVKAHNFDCPNSQTAPAPNPGRTYYDGKMYLFAYGIPNFYCESSINTDLRQAFNNKEGDFWPHVSTGIPDGWLQESFVPIAQDNTYYYNVTFSKQNKENFFSHLPPDWKNQLCYTYYPFRAIYSDSQEQNADNRVNNWLSYGAASLFDFPQNFGKLVSLDGIQNKAILARFENKSLLYNTLLTVDTSNPKAAYLGNDTLFKSSPPIDFAETDLGYVGSQNKFLLKIPQGQITIDAKRGQVFLISGNQATDLSAFGSGLNRFFTDHLAFEILRYFPNADTDNHYNGIGLHGVYDSKYDRVIISKLDYIPATNNIKYDAVAKDFYIIEEIGGVELKTIIDVTDPEYFCNKSWTLSFNMNTKSWISFHSYIPNFYIAENNFFYSGLNGGCDLEAIAVEEIPIGSCFSVYNSENVIAEINYVNVYGDDVPLGLDPYETAYVCGISVMDAPGIETTNLGSCINGCSAPTTTTTSTSTTTTTTTTLNPNCKCITFENLCPIPSSYEYYTCIDELVTGTLAPDEVLTVCGHDGSAGCEGVVITEGPDCTDVLTCVS